jgi:hypothetical protein
MLKIRAEVVQAIHTAENEFDLHAHVQAAIQLEHATIPPYLTAYFSIKPGQMRDIAGVLQSVFVEEMLHMAIASNLLNAIGGQPKINDPAFIMSYPGPLPLGIGADPAGGDLIVGLAPLSKQLVHDVFMQIEEPEDPLEFPVEAAAAAAPTFATIGQFYRAISDKILELGDGIFTGDPSRQVVNEAWFPSDQLFEIRAAADAVKAIGIIVEQGEGTAKSPLDPEGDLAHYYRFAEIFFGKRLIPKPGSPGGFAYAGAPIPFDPAGVWNIVSNAKASQFAAGSRARMLADQFNQSYSRLLNALHTTFNGMPGALDRAMGLMYELEATAAKLVATRDDATGLQAAPPFEYVQVD